MARTAVLGFARIGAKRELKTALEGYWADYRVVGSLKKSP